MIDETNPPPSSVRLHRKGRVSGLLCSVLFVCRDNSTASIMAEALIKHLGGDGYRVFSAGAQPGSELHPLATEVLKARRIWRGDLQPKGCQAFLLSNSPKLDFVIGVGKRWPEGLPSEWPGKPRVMQWHISEPAHDEKETQNRHAFQRTLTELEARIRLFVLILEKEAMKRLAA